MSAGEKTVLDPARSVYVVAATPGQDDYRLEEVDRDDPRAAAARERASAIIDALPADAVEAANVIGHVLSALFMTSGIPVDGVAMAASSVVMVDTGLRGRLYGGSPPKGLTPLESAASMQEMALVIGQKLTDLPNVEAVQLCATLVNASRAELGAIGICLMHTRAGRAPDFRATVQGVGRAMGDPDVPQIILPGGGVR